ncbi:unnamed protein product [Urochloa humidicola]
MRHRLHWIQSPRTIRRPPVRRNEAARPRGCERTAGRSAGRRAFLRSSARALRPDLRAGWPKRLARPPTSGARGFGRRNRRSRRARPWEQQLGAREVTAAGRSSGACLSLGATEHGSARGGHRHAARWVRPVAAASAALASSSPPSFESSSSFGSLLTTPPRLRTGSSTPSTAPSPAPVATSPEISTNCASVNCLMGLEDDSSVNPHYAVPNFGYLRGTAHKPAEDPVCHRRRSRPNGPVGGRSWRLASYNSHDEHL